MIFQGIDVSGSFDITGSFVTAKGAAFPLTASSVQGDMFFHTTLDTMYVFTTSGSWTPIGDITSSTPPPPADLTPNIEYLVVAGGGGSAYDSGGGAGAGGLLSSSIADVASGSVMTVTVGAGGGVQSDGTNSSLASTSGTSFTTVTATGGGQGAGAPNQGAGYVAGDGGSGGGGSGGSYNNPGGSGIVGQGHDGGNSGTSGGGATYPGAGGGGAGAAGESSVNSGGNGRAGGIGKQSTITGTTTYYAGGGGGGVGGGATAGAGGSGGGGAGGSSAQGTAGTANTGGGAGGSSITAGVAGGSGVVILAYPTSSATGQGGVKTTRSDGHFVHTFNESGTFTLGGSDFHTIAPSENFNVITYSGTGGTQTITGANFQPDFVWVKNRGTTNAHILTDVIRGAGNVLYSNLNNAQADESAYFTAFSADGFSLAQAGGNTNTNGGNYVAWCWKAGGTATSNSNGTITSSVSANTKAGFSITKYTGNGTAGASVGHGLTSKPELIIWKNFDATANWLAYADDLATNHEWLYLNATNALQTSGATNEYPTNKQRPTNSVVYLNGAGSSNNINISGEDTIMYCFHSVSGYQKIGTYTGTSGDITVTTGFRPKFVMVKRTNSTGHWEIHDSVRFSTIKDENGASSRLRANENSSEGSFNNSPIFFTETGFTLDSSVSANSYGDYDANGSTYLYLAISE